MSLTKKSKKKNKQVETEQVALFGAPLAPDNENSIPEFVEKLIAYLEANALDEEGLFRVPGDNTVMQKTKKELNAGATIEFDSLKNVNTCAGLLKLYFRELPEPLCTFDHYDMFIAAEGVPEPHARLLCIKKILKFLPPANAKLLKLLCSFLHKVMQHQNQNKMSASNLAIVFAPNLLRPRDDNILTSFADSKHANGMMQTLITEYAYLFDEESTPLTPATPTPAAAPAPAPAPAAEPEPESTSTSTSTETEERFDLETKNAHEATEAIKRLSVRLNSGMTFQPKGRTYTTMARPLPSLPPGASPPPGGNGFPPVPPGGQVFGRRPTPERKGVQHIRRASELLPPPSKSNLRQFQPANSSAPVILAPTPESSPLETTSPSPKRTAPLPPRPFEQSPSSNSNSQPPAVPPKTKTKQLAEQFASQMAGTPPPPPPKVLPKPKPLPPKASSPFLQSAEISPIPSPRKQLPTPPTQRKATAIDTAAPFPTSPGVRNTYQFDSGFTAGTTSPLGTGSTAPPPPSKQNRKPLQTMQ